MEWKTIERPGHLGKHRDERYSEFNQRYGEGNWRLAWQWHQEVLLFPEACKIYEEAYFIDSFRREEIWKELLREASNVYDYQESDVESGLGYLIQKAPGTHLQDIAVRNVAAKRGWGFQGKRPVQIRSHKSRYGLLFSPGKIPFHFPECIVEPHLESWWDYNSIEDFWQSNKWLQVLL